MSASPAIPSFIHVSVAFSPLEETSAMSPAFGNYKRDVVRLFVRAEFPKLINDRRQQEL